MPEGLLIVVLLAGAPAVASVVGGWTALHHRPSTLLASIVFGFAGGAILGTVAIEMVPHGVESAGVWVAMGAFLVGFAVIYAFDLLIHRGVVAGEQAEQYRRVQLSYRRKPRSAERLSCWPARRAWRRWLRA